MSDPSEVYRGFLSLEFSKALRVSPPLLAELERAAVINDGERARIDSLIYPADKITELFVQFMPAKNRFCQKSLVDILSEFKMDQISDYLRSWIPCLAIRTLIAEPIWKEERSINVQDKAHEVELINGYLKELEIKKIDDGDCKDHPEIINIYIRLGELYYEIENYMEASVHFRRAIQDMDLNNCLKITAEFSLARCYFVMAEYPEAEILFKQCLTAQQKLYGAESQAVFLTLYWYATTLVELDDFKFGEDHLKSAKEMYRRSLEIGRKIYGSVSFEVAMILCDLGNTFNYTGYDNWKEAATAEEAYGIQQKIIGSKNPSLSLKILSRISYQYFTYYYPHAHESATVICSALEIYRTQFKGRETISFCWEVMSDVYNYYLDIDNRERICNVALKILDEKFVSNNYNNIWRVRFLDKLAPLHMRKRRFTDAMASCKIVFEKLDSLPGWKAHDYFRHKILLLYLESCFELENYLEFKNGCTDLLNLSLRVHDLNHKKTLAVLEKLAYYFTLKHNKACDIDLIKLTLQYATERGDPQDLIDRLSSLLSDIESDLAKSSTSEHQTEPASAPFKNEHRTEEASKAAGKFSFSRLKKMFTKK